MPVDPGIIDASIILPFIIMSCPPPYMVAMKNSTIDSASNADNCTNDFVAGSSSLRNAKMKKKMGKLRWNFSI